MNNNSNSNSEENWRQVTRDNKKRRHTRSFPFWRKSKHRHLPKTAATATATTDVTPPAQVATEQKDNNKEIDCDLDMNRLVALVQEEEYTRAVRRPPHTAAATRSNDWIETRLCDLWTEFVGYESLAPPPRPRYVEVSGSIQDSRSGQLLRTKYRTLTAEQFSSILRAGYAVEIAIESAQKQTLLQWVQPPPKSSLIKAM